MSLLSGSLTWLNDEKGRAEKGKLSELEATYAQDDGLFKVCNKCKIMLTLFLAPQWIVKQSVEFARRRLLLEQEDFQARLEKARKKEESIRRLMNARVTKRRVSLSVVPPLEYSPTSMQENRE